MCREVMHKLKSYISEEKIGLTRGATQESTDQDNIRRMMPSLSLGLEIESEEGSLATGFVKVARVIEVYI
jgi:hypothetical protein